MMLSADLYYGGEAFSVEQPQSFTCPYCGKMGYTEVSLQEHVTSEHAETSTEVVSVLYTGQKFHIDFRFINNVHAHEFLFESGFSCPKDSKSKTK